MVYGSYGDAVKASVPLGKMVQRNNGHVRLYSSTGPDEIARHCRNMRDLSCGMPNEAAIRKVRHMTLEEMGTADAGGSRVRAIASPVFMTHG